MSYAGVPCLRDTLMEQYNRERLLMEGTQKGAIRAGLATNWGCR